MSRWEYGTTATRPPALHSPWGDERAEMKRKGAQTKDKLLFLKIESAQRATVVFVKRIPLRGRRGTTRGAGETRLVWLLGGYSGSKLFWAVLGFSCFPTRSNQAIFRLWWVGSRTVARLAHKVSATSQQQLALALSAAPSSLPQHGTWYQLGVTVTPRTLKGYTFLHSASTTHQKSAGWQKRPSRSLLFFS